MSIMAPRRRPDAALSGGLNQATVAELSAAAAKSFTGSVEVVDRATRCTARLFLYEGGLYAADLDGFSPRVAERLAAAGAFTACTSADRGLLAALDIPESEGIARAVDAGWVSVEALANAHQEYVVAAFGQVVCLPRVKLRMRKGQTTSHFCTLPLPVAPLFGLTTMRSDRLQGTWSMLAPGIAPGTAVLARTASPLPASLATPELVALAAEVDSRRCLDELSWSLGLTRAEAVHVASTLVGAGLARIDAEAAAPRPGSTYLVPEAFGSHRVEPITAAIRPAITPVISPTPVSAPAVTRVELPRAEMVLPLRAMDDVPLRERRLDEAREDVTRLHALLQESVRVEQEAINHTAEVSQRLREARASVARIEMAEAVPHGLA